MKTRFILYLRFWVFHSEDRDLVGVRTVGPHRKESICIQCANRKVLPSAKAISDINKSIASSSGTPHTFRVVCAGSVSARSRDKIIAHAIAKGIQFCDIWSGDEFEERLRSRCEPLLKRFVEGEIFPDNTCEIKRFVQGAVDLLGKGYYPRAVKLRTESSRTGFSRLDTKILSDLKNAIEQDHVHSTLLMFSNR